MPVEPSPPQPEQPEKKAERALVRSELNLEHNAVFTVSTYRKKSREITVREVLPTGEVLERKAIIGRTAGGIETGVLTTHHFKIYLVLLELWDNAQRPLHDPVHFTILKIIKRLSLVNSGKNYQDVKRWLRDLRQIPLSFLNAFYIPKIAKHTDLADVTILNHLHIYERRKTSDAHKTYGYGEFQFDRHILENLVNNHTHPLRLDVVKEFKKHRDLATLLYVYIDRNLAIRDSYEIGLEKLFNHLDLSQRHVRYPSGRKRVIEPVVKELEGKFLSSGILSYCRIHKTQDGKDYKLVAHKKPFPVLASTASATAQQLVAPEPQQPELLVKLIAQGLTEQQSRELLTAFSEQVIRLQLESLPFRLQRYERRRQLANKAAIIYRAIEQNWMPPKSYFDVKEREAQAKRRAELQELARQRQLEEEQRRRAEQEKERQRRQDLMTYYLTLTPEQQQAIDSQAMDNLNQFAKSHARTLKAQGKDPMESPTIKGEFEAQRYRILETLRPKP